MGPLDFYTDYIVFSCPFAQPQVATSNPATAACNVANSDWMGASVYTPCIPNILVTFDYAKAKIPAQAIPDILQSIQLLIAFRLGDQYTNLVLGETSAISLLENTHLVGTLKRFLRVTSRPATNSRQGLFLKTQMFAVAELTILGPNPYNFFPRVNNTASLLILQEFVNTPIRIVSDAQEPSFLGILSNLGGMLTFGQVVLSFFFGLGLLALLDLEGFSLFPHGNHEGEASGGQYVDAGESAGSSGGDSGGSGAYRRVGHHPSEEGAALLLP